jgi:hypothetical protein
MLCQPLTDTVDKLQGLRKHCTVDYRASPPPTLGCGVVDVGLGQLPPTTLQGSARLLAFVYLIPGSSNLDGFHRILDLSAKMTSFPQFGDTTTATEVADAFSDQIRGKNGKIELLNSPSML